MNNFGIKNNSAISYQLSVISYQLYYEQYTV